MPNLNSPILAGDVSGGLHTTSVDKLKGQPVSATAPTNGQTLVWDGSAWAPATPSTGGGGGANGLTYYLDFGTAADSPTTNLPGTPKMLGRTGSATSSTYTSGTLTNGSWTLLAGFVSESTPQDPAVLVIPGGLWDFNIWALGTANQQSPTSIRAKVYTYDGTNAPTLIATSSEQTINTVSAQYSISALVAQTTITATTRIYVEIEARATANGHTATLQFGDGQPSHVHTSLPLVGGTGLWKNVSGVLQSPASLLVDADVDPAAAIAQSKIANLTTDLAAKAGTAQVQVYSTAGTFTWNKPAGAVSVQVTCIGGGGGGGSGRRGAAAGGLYGGGGGAGGGYTQRTIAADLLGSSETVIVGAGGPGAGAQTSDNTNGADGTNGTASSFGTWVTAAGGTRGAQGGVSSGTGGSIASQRAMFLGGGGASSSNTATAAGGGSSQTAGPGGGAGGGITAGGAFLAAGNGGLALATFATGSASSGGATDGASGTVGASVTANWPLAGNAGGGGASSVLGAGGSGAAGGLYGGGGGGGGASLNGNNSGAGGAGARGIVVVTTYF